MEVLRLSFPLTALGGLWESSDTEQNTSAFGTKKFNNIRNEEEIKTRNGGRDGGRGLQRDVVYLDLPNGNGDLTK